MINGCWSESIGQLLVRSIKTWQFISLRSFTEDLFLILFFVRKSIKITYQTSRHEKELSVISSVNKTAELASHSDINRF